MSRTQNMLAMMESIAGVSILKKPPTDFKKQIHIVKTGDLNKKCNGCGHKNKKCTC